MAVTSGVSEHCLSEAENVTAQLYQIINTSIIDRKHMHAAAEFQNRFKLNASNLYITMN